jgi:chromosome segregation ATPase
LTNETDQKKAEVDLLRTMIKARQDLLPPDPFFARTIQSIQEIIDSTRKNIDEDRTRTEQQLAALQRTFTQNQNVQRLPQEQKQLADQLQDQLSKINDARKLYNNAVDAGAADQDAAQRADITAMQEAIEARRKQLADENLQKLQGQQEQTRLTAINAKQDELTKLKEAETAAQDAYFAKNDELRTAQTKLKDATSNDNALDEAQRKKSQIESTLQAGNQSLRLKQEMANMAIEPIKPNINTDITQTREEDRRLLFTLLSGGTIMVFFFVLILWNVHALSMEAPSLSIRSADLQPMDNGNGQATLPPPQNGAASNGKSTNGGDEDHEPAVI